MKKNDRDDAERICDLLRVNLLPECYMLPTDIRELRRVLYYRNMVLRQVTQMKNKISGLLMEVGEPLAPSWNIWPILMADWWLASVGARPPGRLRSETDWSAGIAAPGRPILAIVKIKKEWPWVCRPHRYRRCLMFFSFLTWFALTANKIHGINLCAYFEHLRHC